MDFLVVIAIFLIVGLAYYAIAAYQIHRTKMTPDSKACFSSDPNADRYILKPRPDDPAIEAMLETEREEQRRKAIARLRTLT